MFRDVPVFRFSCSSVLNITTHHQIWLCIFPKVTVIVNCTNERHDSKLIYREGWSVYISRVLILFTRAWSSALSPSLSREVILARISFSVRRFISAAMAKPRCFFDIKIGDKPAGRIIFEVSVLSFDYRPYDSCAHTARFFLRQVSSLYLFAYVLHLYWRLILSFVIYSSEVM